MSSRAPFRLLLVTLLTTGLGLAVEAVPASAAAHGKVEVSVHAKKKKKHKKATVKLAGSGLGKILVAANGRTLYAFDPDGTDTSASKCTGGCQQIWPALTVAKPVAGKGLDKAKLTVGGANQVAYGGHLLYEFSGDSAKGDMKGQGIGGIWHVVGADGRSEERRV